MTREEAIIEAGIEYSIQNSPYCIGGDNFYEKARELNRNKSFEAGVIWADKNPKSPWISAKEDLPCNHEELIRRNAKNAWTVCCIVSNGTCTITDRMSLIEGEWNWGMTNVKYWFPIPELPKEKEIKL